MTANQLQKGFKNSLSPVSPAKSIEATELLLHLVQRCSREISEKAGLAGAGDGPQAAQGWKSTRSRLRFQHSRIYVDPTAAPRAPFSTHSVFLTLSSHANWRKPCKTRRKADAHRSRSHSTRWNFRVLPGFRPSFAPCSAGFPALAVRRPARSAEIPRKCCHINCGAKISSDGQLRQ